MDKDAVHDSLWLIVPFVTARQALAVVYDTFIDSAPCCAASSAACKSAQKGTKGASHGGSYSRKECCTYCGARARTHFHASYPSDSARSPANSCGTIQFFNPF